MAVAAILTLIVAPCVASTVEAAQIVRWETAQGGNGHYYLTVARADTSRTVASQLASAMGGRLASVSTEAENLFVAQLASAPELWVQLNGDSCCSYGPWLGGTRPLSSFPWSWPGEGRFSYTNWYPGEPGTDTAMHYYATPAGARGAAWNDIAPSTLLGGFVVELEDVNLDVRTLVLSGAQAAELADGIRYANPRAYSMNEAGDVQFTASLTGPGVTAADEVGYWRATAGQTRLVHRSDSTPIATNDAGDIAYAAVDGIYARRGSGAVELVMTTDQLDALSGFGASYFRNPPLVEISPAGRVRATIEYVEANPQGVRAFHAVLAEDATGSFHLAARERLPLPSLPDNPSLDFISSTRFNDRGDLLINGYLQRGSQFPSALVVRRTDGTFQKLVERGDPAAGLAGFEYIEFHAVSFRDQWIAYRASTNAPPLAGVWVQQLDGAPQLVVKDTDQPPGIEAPARFLLSVFSDEDLKVNASGDVAFADRVRFDDDDGANDVFGLWSRRDGNLALVVKEGDPAPDRPAGDVINPISGGFSGGFTDFLLNDDGRVAFSALIYHAADSTLLDAIYAQDASNALRLIAAQGQKVDVDSGPGIQLRMIAEIYSMVAFNGRGQLAFNARLSDGTVGVFTSDAVAVPEPAPLLLIFIATLAAHHRSRCISQADLLFSRARRPAVRLCVYIPNVGRAGRRHGC